jgi:hypothetical protein
VANSNQAFYALSVSSGWSGSSGLQWADEVIDLLDEIAVERLPDHLTARRREQLEQRRAERERQEHEHQEARDRLARFGEDLEAGLREHATGLSDAEREQIDKDITALHGSYTPTAWQLREAMKAPVHHAAVDGDGEPASEAGQEVEDAGPSAGEQ